MDRIKLSKEEKLLLKRLSARKYPDQVLEEDLKVFMILENESLVHGTKGKDGILAPRLTAMGEAYIASNPKLKKSKHLGRHEIYHQYYYFYNCSDNFLNSTNKVNITWKN